MKNVYHSWNFLEEVEDSRNSFNFLGNLSNFNSNNQRKVLLTCEDHTHFLEWEVVKFILERAGGSDDCMDQKFVIVSK